MQGDADIKYIDPTYMIRAIPTSSNDRVYCKVLGQGAVHAAFAGMICLEQLHQLRCAWCVQQCA